MSKKAKDWTVQVMEEKQFQLGDLSIIYLRTLLPSLSDGIFLLTSDLSDRIESSGEEVV